MPDQQEPKPQEQPTTTPVPPPPAPKPAEPSADGSTPPASLQTLSIDLAPGVTVELVCVPAGEFVMGSNKAQDPEAGPAELPPHTVYVGEFYMAKYPVTVAQFATFVKKTGYKRRAVPQDVKNKGRHPVVNVSWEDAVAFCGWASQATGQPVHLPSEAEWEKAARGTDGRIWPWGNEPPDATRCNFNTNMKGTTPVGHYSPGGDSPYGCADMAGNVWEWMLSKYKPYPYKTDDDRDKIDSSSQFRVVRGGSWAYSSDHARCADRDWYAPVIRFHDFGFRLVVRRAPA